MSNNNSGFSVLDMAKSMADENNTDVNDLFTKPVKNEQPTEVPTEPKTEEPAPPEPVKKKVPWTPDADVIKDMKELNQTPVTYDKTELTVEEDTALKNIADDNAIQDSREAMDELSRTAANIDDAKKRHGINKLQIPPGPYHVSITAAAGDTNYKRAQEGLDEILKEIKELHPEFVMEWADDAKNDPMNKGVEAPTFHQNGGKIIDLPSDKTPVNDVQEETSRDTTEDIGDDKELKIVIDKSSVPTISWSQEDIAKIRKSRSVELNIVEAMDIDYSQIEDADDNAVDKVLAQYHRKTNDIVAALPASNYRATITGLSYTEVIDLTNSQEMNNLDGERKKWSLCFDHIRNQSIGPWEEYQWYIDPQTKKKTKIPFTASIPPGIDPDSVHEVTRFQDFLQKTSFNDLEFILWKILCATAMDQEIIQIDCHTMHNGVECGKSYDWIYSPSSLLMMDSIDPAVLEDMERTAKASSQEEVAKVYNSSMLNTNNVTELPTSGFKVVFGHISAYEYLSSIYSEIKALETAQENDPTLASKAMMYTALTCIKAFLVPNGDGKYKRISGINNLIKVMNTLDEIDWQIISELVRIMIEPYQFKYALRDIVCPQCKNKSVIPIDNMTRLLFIVARSLSSVQVKLKRN